MKELKRQIEATKINVKAQNYTGKTESPQRESSKQNTKKFQSAKSKLKSTPGKVQMGRDLDDVASYSNQSPAEKNFQPSKV